MRTAVKATPEPAQRGSSIQAQAMESGAAQPEIAQLYDHEFAELEATATVRDFLAVLASRRVRATLRLQHPARDVPETGT